MTRTLCACAALVLLASPAGAQTQASDPPTVVTSGEGVVEAVPDVARFTVAAEARASNPREAQQRGAALMGPVLDRLRGIGLQDDAIRTRAYDVEPEYDFTDGRRTLRGYVARNSAEVRVDDLDRLGEVMAVAVTAGATSVGGVIFDVTDRAALEREALRLAVADARARAEAAAAGAGLEVASVLRIDEQGAPRVGPIVAFAQREGVQADVPLIAAGPIEVRAQVTLTALLR